MAPLLLLLSLFFSDILLLSSANSITLSLSLLPPPSANPLENLKYHAAASLARAQNLMQCHNDAHLPLYRSNYGKYTVKLSFGTPLQNLSLIMDTSSDLVWVPCTHNYNCTDCPTHIPTFIPKLSSSCKNITCTSPQCKWLSYTQCINHTKCGYTYGYGFGYTTGWLISEELAFPRLRAHDFILGCSVSSGYIPEGIVGFGRGRTSLPAQLGFTSFSYCLVSRDLDDPSSDLVLTTSRGGCKHPAANYTPFVSNTAHPDYYYVSLESISIGSVHVNMPTKYLLPNAHGHGGTIVDSRTTYTMLEQSIFDLFFEELNKQVGKTYRREEEIEYETQLKPCYIVKKNKILKLPQVTFHFQGNTDMILPLANYFSHFNESVVCMTIVSSIEVDIFRGPVIILGNRLQQDFYMEYDLECNRLGIRQQKCK